MITTGLGVILGKRYFTAGFSQFVSFYSGSCCQSFMCSYRESTLEKPLLF